MKDYEQQWQRNEQNKQNHQNIILNIATPSTPDNRAKAKAKTGPSRPEHNAGHRNEQTPDNRPKAKAKTGPSPNRNQNLPPFPTGDNPESTPKPKAKAQPKPKAQPKAKAQGPPPVQKYMFKKNQNTSKSKPKKNTRP